MGRVDGKVAIVTGAAQGLGAADARMLSREGARVIATDVNADAGRELASGIDALFVRQDVSDEGSWTDLMARVERDFGRLDVLVNNAGIAIVADIEATTTEIWRRTLAVHLDGTFFGCRAALPLMAASGGGSIVNMSSTAALVGIPPFLAYTAAKGGIRSMTKAIAAHCLAARNGIRCNSVHPGSIDTPMVQSALADTRGIRLEEAEDPDVARRALGIGEPDDVANLVLYLASDESKHVNGAELVIDNAATAI
jgi:3(or 17)beta-hydroxysteroid dehydrogenase